MSDDRRDRSTLLLTDAAVGDLAFRAKNRSDWNERAQAADRWARAWANSGIEQTKELEVQASFLSRVFVDILGYEDQGSGAFPWTLTAEPTSDVDARRADATLGHFTPDKSRTRAVLELKDAATNLDAKQMSRRDRLSPVEQAFLYVAGYEDADFVLVCNFARLRLYAKQFGLSRYQEFDLTRLDRPDDLADLLGVCSPEMLVGTAYRRGELTQHLRGELPRRQAEITKEFYEHYAAQRDSLVSYLASEHPTPVEDPIAVGQKILDRVLFIAFAEDVGLLPSAVLRTTIEHARQSRSRSEHKVWDELRYLFEDVDKGRPDFSPSINRFNGGLFARDAVLDNQVLIPNDLATRLAELGQFDFRSEFDVNILGHVFENSIADIEILRREMSLLGENIERDLGAVDRQRRQLGVYYTPSWVTSFITDQTVGRAIQEGGDEFRRDIRILDPACGSGAFLSEALSYLTDYARSLAAEELVLGQADLLTSEYATEKARDYLDRLYGMDLLEESVEISKLSLWLKSATRTEPLNDIENLVRGNFLVPGDHDLHWGNTAVGKVVSDGGFDVVLGNPPWGADIDYPLAQEIETLRAGQFDSYELFIERLFNGVLREGGYFGFIIPDRILRPEGERTRRFLFDNFQVLVVVKLGEGVFPGVARASVIVVIKCSPPVSDSTYTGLVITKNDREELERVGAAQLATLVEQRGGAVSTERVTESSSYDIPLVSDLDLRIQDKMAENAAPWLGTDGIFGEYGRGEELGRDTFTVQCPSCFEWSVNPRKRAERRGGGYEPKTCPECEHEFTVDEALRRETAVVAYDEDNPDLIPMYSGEEVNRYALGRPMGLRRDIPGVPYKEASLYEGPKLLVRQTSLGIYATIDHSDARCLQSVYVYHLRPDAEEALEFYLAQLVSRAMVFYYYVLTNQVEWQSFPKLTHATLQKLPLVKPDLDSKAGRERHDRIAQLVRQRMNLADPTVEDITDSELTTDEEIERLVMDLYGLSPDERARINTRLRPDDNVRIIRELYPRSEDLAAESEGGFDLPPDTADA